MKKGNLSIIHAFFLILGAMASSAFAQPEFDIILSERNPGVNDITEAEIWIRNMPGTDFRGFMVFVSFDTSVLQVNDVKIYDKNHGGWCFDPIWSYVEINENCANVQGARILTVPCDISGMTQVKLATITFEALTTDENQICAQLDGSTACTYYNDDGFVEDDQGQLGLGEVTPGCAYINRESITTTINTVTTSYSSTSSTTTIITTTSTTKITPSTTTTYIPATTTTSSFNICPVELIYGKYSEEAALLRYLRDKVLSTTPEGQKIIRLYYEWSPAIVKTIENDKESKEDVKKVIDEILILTGLEAE